VTEDKRKQRARTVLLLGTVFLPSTGFPSRVTNSLAICVSPWVAARISEEQCRWDDDNLCYQEGSLRL